LRVEVEARMRTGSGPCNSFMRTQLGRELKTD
jgi:hypothetical protein